MLALWPERAAEETQVMGELQPGRLGEDPTLSTQAGETQDTVGSVSLPSKRTLLLFRNVLITFLRRGNALILKRIFQNQTGLPFGSMVDSCQWLHNCPEAESQTRPLAFDDLPTAPAFSSLSYFT